MQIAIHSEMDSRILLYPLIQCLYHYGSIGVFSNNPYVRRMTDGEYTNTVNNVTLFYDQEATSDEMREYNGVSSDDYDFLIYDNCGESGADLYLIPTYGEMSSKFEASIDAIREDPNVIVIQYGRPALSTKSSLGLATKKAAVDPLIGFDPAKKFNEKRDSKEKQHERQKSAVCVPMPSFDMVEKFEGMHVFPEPNTKLISILYPALKATINVDKRNFEKAVRRVESGSFIKR